MSSRHAFPSLSAEEAAELIPDGAMVGFSGFTPAGAAKAVPRALAARARSLHEKGEPFRIRVLAGASTGEHIDEALAQAEAIAWRAPYQSSPTLRRQINSEQVGFVDLHLSHMPQMVLENFYGPMDFAVIEASEITPDGRVFLTSSIGASPTWMRHAGKVIIEVNRHHSARLREMADIYLVPKPPRRSPIPIFHPMDRVGSSFAVVDPKKVIGVVETDESDGVSPFSPPDDTCRRIASHVVDFLAGEMKRGIIPPDFLPLQAGVGNISNAVMGALGGDNRIPPFYMFTEVFQDGLVKLMSEGRIRGASTTALTLSDEVMARVYENMDFFAERLVLRPQELTNNPGVVRRLGVICMNTVLEVDLYGHANSTHVCGMQIVNGVGGSGDFSRNAYYSILMCPSTAKGGRISTIVPMCTHVDHNEHTVQIVVTDQGFADLRGRAPHERSRLLIDQCAHPAYRDYLHKYLEKSPLGHIRHDLGSCFELHRNLLEHGAMLPDVKI